MVNNHDSSSCHSLTISSLYMYECIRLPTVIISHKKIYIYFLIIEGKRGWPGYWAAADSGGGGVRPFACAAGTSLMIDQCNGGPENGCIGRPSP